MAPFGASYNPANVMMGRPSSGSSPYLWSGPGSKPPMPGPMPTGGPVGARPISTGDTGSYSGAPASTTVPLPSYSGLPASTTVGGGSAPTGGVLAPRNVRATGTGPFDPAYRQNLASYAGGQFSGDLSFNPTDISSFPGQPTGGGTAPVTGMPTSLMDVALAGQGFSWTPPPPPNAAVTPPQFPDMGFWMDNFMRNGRGQRMGSFL